MDERQLETVLDRIDQAVGRIEGAFASRDAAAAVAVGKAAELASLSARHDELKRAVATGLRQLDEVLAGLPK